PRTPKGEEMGIDQNGTINPAANRAGNAYQGGPSCSADSSAQAEFAKAFGQEAPSDAGQTLATDPTVLTPREEALHKCLPEKERHLPHPFTQKSSKPAASSSQKQAPHASDSSSNSSSQSSSKHSSTTTESGPCTSSTGSAAGSSTASSWPPPCPPMPRLSEKEN